MTVINTPINPPGLSGVEPTSTPGLTDGTQERCFDDCLWFVIAKRGECFLSRGKSLNRSRDGETNYQSPEGVKEHPPAILQTSANLAHGLSIPL